jgi:hypothetical protein
VRTSLACNQAKLLPHGIPPVSQPDADLYYSTDELQRSKEQWLLV